MPPKKTTTKGPARPKLPSSHSAKAAGPKKSAAKRKAASTQATARNLAPTPRLSSTSAASSRKPRSSTSSASDSARQVAIGVATAALDKKATGVEVIDVAGKVDYTDFLVLMSGRSDRHVQALAGSIEEALRSKSVRPMAIEGAHRGSWVVMDYGDVVAHIFQEEARNLYDLDGLWIDARRISLPTPERVGE